jgi:hypothetical protein
MPSDELECDTRGRSLSRAFGDRARCAPAA